MSLVRVIVGLGNPGAQYEHTRHNAGFEVVDRLAQRFHCDRWKSDFQGVIGDVRLEGSEGAGRTGNSQGNEPPRVLLVKPQTFMNLSGACVQPLLAFYKVAPKDCLVVVDEMNLELGEIRLRQTGSHGGHNGLRDLQARLGTEDYPRLRVGVGKPSGSDAIGHVLGRFADAEWSALSGGLDSAAQAAERFARGGFSAAQKWWTRVCQEKETAERKERIRLETERRKAAEAKKTLNQERPAPPANRNGGEARDEPH